MDICIRSSLSSRDNNFMHGKVVPCIYNNSWDFYHPSGVDPGFSKGGRANGGKGEWGVPPPTQSREAFAIIVCD